MYIYCFLLLFPASLLKGLKHNNIVTLHDIIHTPSNLTFVFEYVVRGLQYQILCLSGLVQMIMSII